MVRRPDELETNNDITQHDGKLYTILNLVHNVHVTYCADKVYGFPCDDVFFREAVGGLEKKHAFDCTLSAVTTDSDPLFLLDGAEHKLSVEGRNEIAFIH